MEEAGKGGNEGKKMRDVPSLDEMKSWICH